MLNYMEYCSVESLQYIYTVQKSKAALVLSNSVIYQDNLCTLGAAFFVCTHFCFVCVWGEEVTMYPDHHGSLSEKGQRGSRRCYKERRGTQRGDTERGLW